MSIIATTNETSNVTSLPSTSKAQTAKEVIAANPKQLEQYRAGKKTVAAFFVGQVMRLSKGQANPALLNELVAKKLDA